MGRLFFLGDRVVFFVEKISFICRDTEFDRFG